MPQMSSFLVRTQTWAKAHGALTGFLGLLSGAVLGIGIPMWQTYWVDTPRLALEIYAIDRQVSSDARIPSDDDALSVLSRVSTISNLQRWFLDSPVVRPTASLARGGYTPKELSELLSLAKAEQRALPERIEERQRQLRDVEALSADRMTLSDVNRLNGPINNELKPAPSFATPTPEGLAERQRAIVHFRSEYTKRFDDVQKRYTELQTQLPAAERRADELKKELEDKKGYFRITAILNNSGRKSVSIRQLALLRVYIGKGNYVDLKLNLDDYQNRAEVIPNGTRIAVFLSDLLETFPDADRTLVGTYWGQSVHGILFVEDVQGAIHSSNRISFAKGLYVKELYDRLTGEAAKIRYQHVSN